MFEKAKECYQRYYGTLLPDDDFFFMPAGSGNAGYYSIYSDNDSNTNEDIYLITFGEK